MAPDSELADVPARVAAGERVVLRPSKRRKLGSLLLGLWAVFFVAASTVSLGETLAGLLFLIPSLPVAAVVRLRRGPQVEREPARAHAIEIDAGEEVERTAAACRVPQDLAGRIVEGRYEYLDGHPRDSVIEADAEREWIVERTGVDAATVRRVLDAHDDFLRRAGVLTDA